MTDPQHPSTEQFPAAAPPAATDEVVTEQPAPERGRARVAVVAAVAVAVLAVGGGGGFAIGRATAPDTATTSTVSDQQFPGDGGQMGTPPDGFGGQMGTPPDQQSGTTTDGTTSEPTT